MAIFKIIFVSNNFYSWELFSAQTKFISWNFKPIYRNLEHTLYKVIMLSFSWFDGIEKNGLGFT